MSSYKLIALSLTLAAAFTPSASHAAAARGYTADETAVAKVSEAVIERDLKFVTSQTTNICGTTGTEGTDVKVQIAANGRFITIRHYGVTYAGFWSREKAIECAN
jgi:hypothetical protein